MKKITPLFFVVFFVASLSAQTWCGDSFITVNNVWYTANNSYTQPAGLFNGANIGTFTTSGFTLGGELQAYPAVSIPATLWYKIDGGSPVEISLPKVADVNNNSKHYGEAVVSINTLTNASHSIEVWFQAGTVYDSNSTKNFVASFTKSFSSAINNIASTLKISSQSGKIIACFDGKAQVQLFTCTGQLICATAVENEFNKSVNRGAYLLRIDGQCHKLIVQ